MNIRFSLTICTALFLCSSVSAQKKKTNPVVPTSIPSETIANDGLTLLYGNAMVEKLQEEGSFESYLHLANPGKKIQFRSCAYVGDQIDFRIRASRFGLHLKYLLEQWEANRVIMAFGANESYAGAAGLAEFEKHLENYLQVIKARHGSAEYLLASPTASEKVSVLHGVDLSQRNRDLKLYSESMKKIAEKHKITFIDLFTPTAELFQEGDATFTVNGHNLSNKGSAEVGRILATAIKGPDALAPLSPSSPAFQSVQKMVQRKTLEASQAYHPANGISYYGLRKRSYEYNTEIPHYLKLANILDQAIWQQAKNPATISNFPELPVYKLTAVPNKPPKRGLGIVKSSHDDLKDFTVAEGFNINCFASSEDHPELINPLQVQFDSRGRLWVSCFASYPHPVPGQVSNDSILIFEDTNHDGKADQKTIFADGLDLPDGFAFYKNGIIASTARKLIYLEDTNSDSKADIRTEILRGFDNTDTHHSGYLQRSPHGDLILSEALFHRGQFETPHGVLRTKDTTIMSLDMDTRKLTVERQTESPNPWKVTFNKWGESIQFYGGGQIIDADSHNVATPMGSAAPTQLGMPFRYDKGVSTTFVDSPIFPQTWQGGLLTTHLLTKNEINYTPLKLVDGTYKAAGKPTKLVSSSNKVFRPTDIVFGHDGALYVSDFYYPIIGHAQHSIRHKNRDYANGRIWRISRKGTSVLKPENLEEQDTTSLIAKLKNPFLSIRQSARIELEKKPAAEVNSALASAAEAHQADDVFALELLWLMERQKNFTDTSLIKRLVASSDTQIRRSAVRSLRWWGPTLSTDLASIITKLASDDDERVKMGLITVISHLHSSQPALADLDALITAKPKTPLAYMKQMLSWKDRTGLAAEFPILEVAPDAYLPDSLWIKKSRTAGYFYFQSTKAQQLNIGHSGNPQMNITTNDTPLLITSGSPHSRDSQNAFTVQKGINKVEYSISKGMRSNNPFKMYLTDAAGNKSPSITLPSSAKQSKKWGNIYDQKLKANWQDFALKTFKQNCANCHNIDTKAVGPPLTSLFGKTQTIIDKKGNKKEVTVDEAYLRRSIVNPTAEYPEGYQPIMIKMPLNDKEVDLLVRWIKELK